MWPSTRKPSIMPWPLIEIQAKIGAWVLHRWKEESFFYVKIYFVASRVLYLLRYGPKKSWLYVQSERRPCQTELITNMAAANNTMQISLKNLSNVLSSYILRLVHLGSSFVSKFGCHSWKNECLRVFAMLWAGPRTWLKPRSWHVYGHAHLCALFCNI